MVVDIDTSEGFDCEQAFGTGHFQHRLTLFTAVTLRVGISHGVALPLISADVDHWCRQPTGGNLAADTWKTITIPVDPHGLSHIACTVYANPGDPNGTRVLECDAWDYDPQRVNGSIVSEWNLVCSRCSLKTIANIVFMAGSVVILLLSRYCSDCVGLLPAVLHSATVLITATLGTCFTPSYPAYLVTRFLISGNTMSMYDHPSSVFLVFTPINLEGPTTDYCEVHAFCLYESQRFMYWGNPK
ncbi:solute carrier family 22 member 6-like [Haemaphysalis longicornis]